jgi:hypothetical protein
MDKLDNINKIDKIDKYVYKFLNNPSKNIYQDKINYYSNQVGGTIPTKLLLGKFFYTDVDISAMTNARLVFETQEPSNNGVYPNRFIYYYLDNQNMVEEKVLNTNQRFDPGKGNDNNKNYNINQAINNLKYYILRDKGIIAFNIDNQAIQGSLENNTLLSVSASINMKYRMNPLNPNIGAQFYIDSNNTMYSMRTNDLTGVAQTGYNNPSNFGYGYGFRPMM